MATACCAEQREGRSRLHPLVRRLHREVLRRGKDPRRVHQARRPAQGQGSPRLAAHRPAHPAPVLQALPARDPGHPHGHLHGPGQSARHPGNERGLRRNHHLRHSVRRAHRRRAHGVRERRARGQPDLRPDRGEHDRPGRCRHGRRASRWWRAARGRSPRPSSSRPSRRRTCTIRELCTDPDRAGAEGRQEEAPPRREALHVHPRQRRCGAGRSQS